MRTVIRLAVLVMAAVMGPRLPAVAQEAGRAQLLDVRWSAWLGCWTPVDARRTAQDVQVCVVPTADGAGVTMLTFAGDQTILEERIVADRAPRPVEESGCDGSRQSRWAEHGIRLFTTATLRCEGQPAQQTSGIAALVSSNEWLDIQVVDSGGREAVRTRRYARSSGAAPASVAEGLRALSPAPPVAAAALTIDDVVEAHRAVSPRAVEAWLVETEPRLAIDRRALLKMTEARVTEPVIDLLVALAYPRHFEVRRPTPGGSGGGIGPIISAESPGGFFGPWGFAYDPYALMYSPFGMWYYPGFSDYFYTSPYYGGYIEIPGSGGSGQPASAHGQVVNGLGYTHVQPREPAVDTSAGSRSGGASTSSVPLSSGGSDGGSSGVSGASPAGYSSGGGGGASGGATAVPR